jgi:disulfide oxidoreductase YuzD
LERTGEKTRDFVEKIKDEEFIFSVLLLDEFLKERRDY